MSVHSISNKKQKEREGQLLLADRLVVEEDKALIHKVHTWFSLNVKGHTFRNKEGTYVTGKNTTNQWLIEYFVFVLLYQEPFKNHEISTILQIVKLKTH